MSRRVVDATVIAPTARDCVVPNSEQVPAEGVGVMLVVPASRT